MTIHRRIWAAVKAGLRVIPDALLHTVRDDMEPMRKLTDQQSSLARQDAVIPRDVINIMPIWLQADFRRLMSDLKEHTGHDALNHRYQRILRDYRGRFRARTLPHINDRLDAARQADKVF